MSDPTLYTFLVRLSISAESLPAAVSKLGPLGVMAEDINLQGPSDACPWQEPLQALTAKPPPEEKAPAEKAPAEKAPAEKAPAEKAPAEKAPAEKAPAEKAPAEKASDDSNLEALREKARELGLYKRVPSRLTAEDLQKAIDLHEGMKEASEEGASEDEEALEAEASSGWEGLGDDEDEDQKGAEEARLLKPFALPPDHADADVLRAVIRKAQETGDLNAEVMRTVGRIGLIVTGGNHDATRAAFFPPGVKTPMETAPDDRAGVLAKLLEQVDLGGAE